MCTPIGRMSRPSGVSTRPMTGRPERSCVCQIGDRHVVLLHRAGPSVHRRRVAAGQRLLGHHRLQSVQRREAGLDHRRHGRRGRPGLPGRRARAAGVGRDQPVRPPAVFEQALRIIEDREAEIAEAIIAELGGTRLKAGFELHLAKEFLREAIQLALRPEGRILPSPVDGKENRLYRLPVGVVGVISPFNFPFLLSLKSVAPGPRPRQRRRPQAAPEHPDRAAAPWSPRSSRTRGCPRGLLNVVDHRHRRDRRRASSSTRCPKVISFTGSDKVGRHVATVCRRALQALGPRTRRQQRPGRPRRRRHRLRGRRGRLQPLRPPGPGLHGRQPRARGPLGRARSSPRSSSPRSRP